jgi:hypothetical protein
MELFTATGKLKNIFFDNWRCSMRAPRGAHRYDIQDFATRMSTWVHQYFPLLQWSVPLGQGGL